MKGHEVHEENIQAFFMTFTSFMFFMSDVLCHVDEPTRRAPSSLIT
jgi:hypothetical protein